MEAEGIFPNLGAVACTQLTFGADIRLSASQVGAIRDSVLAQFPAASIPPWYFGEIYQWDQSTYEVAASISSSTRTDPKKAYNAFFRVQRLAEGRIEGPSIRDLFEMVNPQENVIMHCVANFVTDPNSGEPYGNIPDELYRDAHGRLMIESYSLGIFDDSDGRIGSSEVRMFHDGSILYSISFSKEGKFSIDFTEALLSEASSLFRRVHHAREESTDVGR